MHTKQQIFKAVRIRTHFTTKSGSLSTIKYFCFKVECVLKVIWGLMKFKKSFFIVNKTIKENR